MLYERLRGVARDYDEKIGRLPRAILRPSDPRAISDSLGFSNRASESIPRSDLTSEEPFELGNREMLKNQNDKS